MGIKAKIISICLVVVLFATALTTGLCYAFNSRFKKNFNSWFGIENKVENFSGSDVDNTDLQAQLDLKNQELQEVLSENQELENKIDDLNFYFSFSEKPFFDGSFNNYVTDTSTSFSLSDSKNIAVIYNEIFYFSTSDCYKLNLETKIWENYTFNGNVPTKGSYIWSDGNYYYFSDNSIQTKLNRETNTWEDFYWLGFCPKYGHNVWSHKNSVYYTSRNTTGDVITDSFYKLNKETMDWEEIAFYGIEECGLNGIRVWSDGKDCYFSQNTISGNYQFKLNEETMTWENFSWKGFSPLGEYIWSDGKFTFFSYNTYFYVLNKETYTWFSFSCDFYFDSADIFIAGDYVYCFTKDITYYYVI